MKIAHYKIGLPFSSVGYGLALAWNAVEPAGTDFKAFPMLNSPIHIGLSWRPGFAYNLISQRIHSPLIWVDTVVAGRTGQARDRSKASRVV